MGKTRPLLVLVAGALLLVAGCESTREGLKTEGRYSLPTGMKIHVQDVSNDTKEVLDVDVIGLFWDALNLSLKNRSVLWLGDAAAAPLKLQAHILKYKKGNTIQRWAMPGFGTTVLEARVDLLEEGRVLGSATVRRTVALGDGLGLDGWRKVFSLAAEDAVSALAAGASPTP